jgi:bifunctional enzyme CysN/CysC
MQSILRFLACGSIDDGKSTLIGHLLYNTHNIFDDQLETLERESARIGNAGEHLDFSLLLDGLTAEREQGITIDVAYRYFSTITRKYIVADTPGHEQYTRNMACGASNCDAALILVNAGLGVLPQTRRHALICAMMGIRQVAFAVNKMDLVAWERSRFEEIAADCRKIVADLPSLDLIFDKCQIIPVSALLGDNLNEKSPRMSWYEGPTLLEWIENAQPLHERLDLPFRFAVQYVIKLGLSGEGKNHRAYAGTVASGRIRRGERVVILPSDRESVVREIKSTNGSVDQAAAGMAISVVLSDDLDVSRGDGIFLNDQRPEMSDQFKVRLVWMNNEPLFAGRAYDCRGPFGEALATVSHFCDKIDLSAYHKLATEELVMNDVGEAEISLSRPVPFDAYTENRETGAFILVDRLSNSTAAAGMILHSLRRAQNVHWQTLDINMAARSRLMGQKPCLVWFTGLPSSGKSTIANLVEKKLYAMGCHTMLLDGDNIRHGLNKDLGFTEADRVENIRRVGEVGKLLVESGLIVIACFISPYRADRRMVRGLLAEGELIEVFVDTSIEVCEARDPKGLYKKARAGHIPNFTGVNAPYESPEHPELLLDTVRFTAEELAEQVVQYFRENGVLK